MEIEALSAWETTVQADSLLVLGNVISVLLAKSGVMNNGLHRTISGTPGSFAEMNGGDEASELLFQVLCKAKQPIFPCQKASIAFP